MFTTAFLFARLLWLAFLAGAQATFSWFINVVGGAASVVLSGVVNLIPGLPLVDAQFVWNFGSIVNAWIALDVGVTCLVLYYGFLTTFVAVKFTLKLIPSIG